MNTSVVSYQFTDQPEQVRLRREQSCHRSGVESETTRRLLVRISQTLNALTDSASPAPRALNDFPCLCRLVHAVAIAVVWAMCALTTFFPTDAAAQACAQPPQGMVAWWPMDEVSGTTVGDIVGSNSGIRVSGPVSAPGLVGGSLRFNGGGSYVGAPDSDLWAFGANDFTIELWANWDFNPVGSIGHPGTIFIGNDEGPGTTNKWFFALGGGFLNFHINGPSIGGRFFPLVSFNPTVGQWYHLAVTRRGNTYIIYVNGVLAGSATDNGIIPNPNSALTIGQAESLGFMNGRLDEITIYNRALSQAELQVVTSAGSAGKCKALQIATKSLPAIKFGIASSTALTTAFGQAPFSWTLVGGAMPQADTDFRFELFS